MNQPAERSDGRIRSSGRLLSAVSGMASVLRAILQEIFDESAYQRFLDRSRLQSSASTYAVFRQENEQARSRRPRCC